LCGHPNIESPQPNFFCVAICWDELQIQWKPLIMITLGPTLFDSNNQLITLSGGFKKLHYLTQFIVKTFYMYKNNKIYLNNLCNVAVVCLHLVVPE
jgi:hypothetical protein